MLAGLRNGGNPLELGAKLCQFPGLRDVAEMLSGVALIVTSEVLTLEEGCIVDCSTDTRELPEGSFLQGCWDKLVFEAASDHIANIGRWARTLQYGGRRGCYYQYVRLSLSYFVLSPLAAAFYCL